MQLLIKVQHALEVRTGIGLDTLIAGTGRIAITADSNGKTVLDQGADMPGDSVTDALTYARQLTPPHELAAPAEHPEHWQPIVDLFATPTQTENRQATNDRLRATGWSDLANALERGQTGDQHDTMHEADRAALTLIRTATAAPPPTD